jgi:hypothetical protein
MKKVTETYQQGNNQLADCQWNLAVDTYKSIAGYPPADWNRRLVQLLLGDYSEWVDETCLCSGSGFDGQWVPYREMEKPLWDGKPTLKRLVIVADQGVGDAVIFARFLPKIQSLVPNVKIQCTTKEAASLLSHFAPIHQKGEEYDICLPMMLLPQRIGIKTITEEVYLHVDEKKEFKELIQAFDCKKKIGICWSGNPNHPLNNQRSVSKSIFYEIQYPLFSLQFAHSDPKFINLGFLMEDFLATAQLIQCMDLVISVSTSVAVIAAAMGKETWVLLDSSPFWVWGLKEKTPWFPTATLFRPGSNFIDKLLEQL